MYKMSTFLFTLLGLTMGSLYPCAEKREIAPCTCGLREPKPKTVIVSCEQMESFSHIIEVLQNKFSPEQEISLIISFSHLEDMKDRTYEELGMKILELSLNFNDLSTLPESSFKGLEKVEYLSLADNHFIEIPRTVLSMMPKLKTLDLGRNRIANLLNEDLADLPILRNLVLPGNELEKIESYALPKTNKRIHLGKNSLRDLNGSLRALTDLEWLFINGNQLTTLYEQLPPEAPKMILIHAAHNQLTRLPAEIKNYPAMGSLFFNNNNIESLNKVLQKSKHLRRLYLNHNRIETLADDEFAETELMDDIQLGHNHLTSLNGAFLPMRKLRFLNLTHNYLQEFSFQEIRGLKNLKILDLSSNRISQLNGTMNSVEVETRVEELRLEHNEIKALERSLMGIHGLQRLYLSYNKLTKIAPDDLIGLDNLTILDISHNHLQTLDETSKTFLPNLLELIANDNLIQILDKDFHGLPVLCEADLSNNQIHTINPELINKTKCKVRGVYGVLRINLEDNPVICQDNFNETTDLMESNSTKIYANFSNCQVETTTVNATTTTTESVEILNSMNILPILRVNQGEHLPLLFAPHLIQKTENKTESESKNETRAEGIKPDSNNTILKQEENLLHSMIMHPPVVFKDEGSNITIVIPMENGVVKKDHVLDQYTQNEDQNQSRGSSSITNIEIVEIKQLPNDSNQKTNEEQN